MANTLNDHRPDWYSRRCVTCTAPWPCPMARMLLQFMHLDAPRALRRYLIHLLHVGLEVRNDDSAELWQQLVGWAFPRRGVSRRFL